MEALSVSITWLSKVDLSNINSGEGGGGNVVELKTYRGGRRPYASGQSVRHALREAMERAHPAAFPSTPEAPSCDIANDWMCDLFGYLNPKKGEGSDRRWSPLKCTPALGQVDSEIVTDLLLRMSDLEKGDDSAVKDQRLAYVQLTDNVFRTGMVIDVFRIGRTLRIEGDAKEKRITRKEFVDLITAAERRLRVRAVISALASLSDFAKQARNAVSFTPDLFLAAVLPCYTQRGLRTMEMDEERAIRLDVLATVAADLKDLGGELFAGYTPAVVSNGDAFVAECGRLGIPVGNPVAMLGRLGSEVH